MPHPDVMKFPLYIYSAQPHEPISLLADFRQGAVSFDGITHDMATILQLAALICDNLERRKQGKTCPYAISYPYTTIPIEVITVDFVRGTITIAGTPFELASFIKTALQVQDVLVAREKLTLDKPPSDVVQ